MATAQANQIALGSATQTLTVAGLPSAASRTRQSGALQIVTTDASGNLAADGGATLASITANSTGIATNATGIAANTAAIGVNTTAIATNTGAIAANTAGISANTADIATNRNAIAALSGQMGANDAQIRENRDGVAMAMAMSGTSWLHPGESVAMTFNLGHFDGSSALAAGLSLRLDDRASLGGGLAVSGNGALGARLGLRVGW